MLTAGVALAAAVLTYVAGTRSAKTRYEALKTAIEIRGLLREDEKADWDRVVRKHVAYEHSRSVVNVHTTAAGILMAPAALIILAGYVDGYSRFNGTALREWLAGTLVLVSLGLLVAVVAYERRG